MIKNFRRIHDWRNEASSGFPISKIHGMPCTPTILIVRDPICLKHFLKDNFQVYSKPPPERDSVMFYFKTWLGDGIFSAMHGRDAPDGGRGWHLQRKIAANIFKRSIFTGLMNEVFVAKSIRMQGCLTNAAREGSRVDMQKLFFNFTMDSIMKIFFGQEADTLGGETNDYGCAYDVAHECFFQYALRALPFNMLTKYFLPWPFGGTGGLAWRIHRAMSPLHKRFLAANKIIGTESERLIAECRSDPKLTQRRDLLALFIQAEEKEQFSAKFLRDVVLSFVIAGRDTTACTLSWMFYILATNPDIQAKLVEEVDKCLSEKTVTFDSVKASDMPYLNGVLHETLRLYPPVPFDLKECQQDDTLPNGVRIPRGSVIVFLPYAMGRDPEVYPDPMKVKPERWIPFTPPAPHEFPVFQAGPRICLGMDMAIFETKVAACMLLKEYTFQLAPGEAEKISYGRKLTMTVSNDKNLEKESEELWLIPSLRCR